MPGARALRLTLLALANLLLPIAILIFASGFFPYKPFLPGLARFEDVAEAEGGLPAQPEPVFDRVVFMVVDALRSDFVFGEGSGMGFVQSLIRDGAAIPFTAHATPPTVTMPRVKALTTGSVPSFLDLILNFAESDTSSSLAAQDTWLAQLKAARGGKLVFYGDDTWLKLFPDDAPAPTAGGEGEGTAEEKGGEDNKFWLRHDGTSSFFVSDFTEVDNNVTRHLSSELARSDWNAMIMHYLGLDHIGHKTGPQGPNMLPKQREMDGIVKQIYGAMETEAHHERTLLVLAGDHGMNAGGNHGGSGPGETEPALVFASPVFKGMPKRRVYESPTTPKEGTEFHFYTKIGQSDLVPSLAGMMGMPVSKNSLGVIVRELGGLWGGRERLRLLRQNARQLLRVVEAKYGERFGEQVGSWRRVMESDWVTTGPADDEKRLAFLWAGLLGHDPSFWGLTEAEELEYEEEYYRFLELAQETMSDTASSYNIPRMVLGMGLSGLALALAISSFPSLWPPSPEGLFLTLTTGLYGIMMFASSYVEEEQHFWYWTTPAWIALLAIIKLRQSTIASGNSRSLTLTALAALALLTTHRLMTRWNQTGQKHAGAPDIAHTFFPAHHILLWLLILTTYLLNGYLLHQRTFRGLFMPELAAFFTSSMVFLGVVFKLNFTQADAPELVQGLAVGVREWTEALGLVWLARGVFGFLAAAAMGVVVLGFLEKRGGGSKVEERVGMPERLHHLLTLFLMTQTRAPNVPLFGFMEVQRVALGYLFASAGSPMASMSTMARSNASRPLAVALSTLLLAHTTFFCTGGSNSISSIDLSNAYNGVADYNIAAVGIMLFAGNWAGGVWWVSAAVLLLRGEGPATSDDEEGESEGKARDWVQQERAQLRESTSLIAGKPTSASGTPSAPNTPDADAWPTFLSTTTSFIAASLVAVMLACTVLRTHLFIWTVFSPKYLYAMAWAVGWHLVVGVGLGTGLWKLGGV